MVSDKDSLEKVATPEETTSEKVGDMGGKGFAEPVVNQTGLFKRAGRGPTFTSDDTSERFYKPIDAFEGRHRWDPEFEWASLRRPCAFL